MSRENLEQFMNQVSDSEELQARIGEGIDTESLVVLGAECGCEFTAEELQELSRHGGSCMEELAFISVANERAQFLATGKQWGIYSDNFIGMKISILVG